MFLSSHVLSEVERACDTVGIIRGGHLVAEEGVKALLGKRLREVEAVFGEPVELEMLAGCAGVDNISAVNETTMIARAKGDALDSLVTRVATARVVDVRIQQASLEDVFLEFYRDEPVPETAGGEEDR